MSLTAVSPAKTAARPRASLTVAMLGFFVVALDAQIVNVALPAIRNGLGGGLAGLQWVVTGYTLMFSALQLFAGTFSDRTGARRASVRLDRANHRCPGVGQPDVRHHRRSGGRIRKPRDPHRFRSVRRISSPAFLLGAGPGAASYDPA